jgi:alkylation response protein AidB-like acyl-CoA dehydrogenase
MSVVLEQTLPQTYKAIATTLSKTLAQNAVERDLQAGIPDEEVKLLRQAGLLPLVVPHKYGGIGASWIEAFQVVRELAKADGSIGQLYANHITLSIAAQVAGTPTQAEYYQKITAEQNLFWGNAINTRDARLKIEPEGNHYRVNGVKSFGTGVTVADMRVFSAMQDGMDMPLLFVIPRDREGVIYNHDWDNMGQRRTASGSFTFYNVFVKRDEIMGPPPAPGNAFSTLLYVIVQLTKVNVYLGIVEGAFEAAREYTTTTTRPWITSGVERAAKDPYILHHYGELWMELKAAIGLVNQAAEQVQAAWDKGESLTHEERGEAAIAVAIAKAFTTQMGLKLTSRIFEVMGARSTARQNGFDRYWRDLRTFTLHDPVDYKLRSIGDWVLNGEFPMVTQYS